MMEGVVEMRCGMTSVQQFWYSKTISKVWRQPVNLSFQSNIQAPKESLALRIINLRIH